MATWKTVDDFYEHSHVACVRLDELYKGPEKSTSSKGLSYYFNYTFLLLDRHIGLRHLFLIFIITTYSILGGYYLYYFEGKGEAEAVPTRKAAMETIIKEIVRKYKSYSLNETSKDQIAALKQWHTSAVELFLAFLGTAEKEY
ncbi:hypothetical protein OESDEN_02837 [Oesophagostomum dentatum]|uniref:Uncharacterized protein n=1 Tax=Oesophagostomum dentatum TaxID=61180 RepID=A0A0B1TM89_OESDE|nr:hypothetical protein OESDEN_02837 [Oesophagostomum dentatum]